MKTTNSSCVLLVTRLQVGGPPPGGRDKLCQLNRRVLEDIYGDRLVCFEIEGQRITGSSSVAKALTGHIDGVSVSAISYALKVVEQRNVGKIFVDGSNFGLMVKAFKREFPHVEVTTYFHNVEARFFFGAFRHNRTLHALGVLLANYAAERNAVKFADKIVCLSERESHMLRRVYGRGATHISAIAIEEKSLCLEDTKSDQPNKGYALFVGGGFYANREGIRWYAKKVAPHMSMPTLVIGHGLDDIKNELEMTDNVTVIGAVDRLDTWYRGSRFVIAPIFDGSGMKTKVAEALMFGKKIIGTPEAFSGYEDIMDRAGWVCSTPREFIGAIRQAQNMPLESPEAELRAIYEKRYSFAAARSRLAAIMSDQQQLRVNEQ